MELSELQTLSRAMAGYERSRLKRGLLGALPTLVLPLIAFGVGGRLMTSVLLGAAIGTAVVVLAWRGQAWGMAVPAGLIAGVFPLGLALAAQRIGHICTPQGCTSLCVPMCAAGGLIAGLVISAGARRSRSPPTTLVAGGVLSVAIGALGCSCVGMGGMVGLTLGLAASAAVATVLRPAR